MKHNCPQTHKFNALIGSIILFFLNVFGGHIHMSFFGDPGTPVWISGDVSSRFQSQSGFCLIPIVGENVMYIQ